MVTKFNDVGTGRARTDPIASAWTNASSKAKLKEGLKRMYSI